MLRPRNASKRERTRRSDIVKKRSDNGLLKKNKLHFDTLFREQIRLASGTVDGFNKLHHIGVVSLLTHTYLTYYSHHIGMRNFDIIPTSGSTFYDYDMTFL